MFVFGLQGSPRKKGNTSTLLSAFLTEAERLGADTVHLDVPGRNITPRRLRDARTPGRPFVNK